MRLVCPNCVAQYEVADGTIPESGRDVQCANCNHVWFQDAAFKLSTDDLTSMPLRASPDEDDDDDEPDDAPDDDGPDDAETAQAPASVFRSNRAARMSGGFADAPERALPEVGGNVLDILRSEAAFSSRRRAASQPEPPAPLEEEEQEAERAHEAQAEQQPEDTGDRDQDPQDTAEVVFHHRSAPRTGDMAHPPMPEPAGMPDIGPAALAPDIRFGTRRHLVDDARVVPSKPSGDVERPAQDGADFIQNALRKAAADGLNQDREEHAATEAETYPRTDPETETDRDTETAPEMEMDSGLVALHADEAKRIADAAVGRGGGADDAEVPDPEATDQEAAEIGSADAPERSEQDQRSTRRVRVRSIAWDNATRDSAEPIPVYTPRRSEVEPDTGTDADADADADAVTRQPVQAEKDKRTGSDSDPAADPEAMTEDDAGTATGPELDAEPADAPQEAADAEADAVSEPDPEAEPEDIRQVRKSLVQNRKVLLPDVDELNTSLRMEKHQEGVDLRASAFSEEAVANRQKFLLGMVTALMLFGILSGLYLMGPAISDAFPAADPYVAAFIGLVDGALDKTAVAWTPVVAWLETL